MRKRVQPFAGLAAVAVLGLLSAPGLNAQAKKQTSPPAATPAKHTMVTADELTWGPAPPGLPPGAQLAVLDGDPGKAGVFTIRGKFPDGYKVPPHWHPSDEHLTIVSGALKVGTGAKWDDASMHTLTTGGYAKMVKRMNHYVQAQGETIVQLTAMGPFEITYVNPKDDPRKKTN
jgi:quercetin dioxygenase-like cupin family protein